MPSILHILTTPQEPLVQEIISRQTAQPGAKVNTVDLTQPEPDYAALLEKIFEADSVAVW